MCSLYTLYLGNIGLFDRENDVFVHFGGGDIQHSVARQSGSVRIFIAAESHYITHHSLRGTVPDVIGSMLCFIGSGIQ